MKPLAELSHDEIKAAVAERYGLVATAPAKKQNFPVGRRFAESVGYEPALLDRLPCGMWESFTGAGNPQPFVDAQPGETVLDLGCGAGLDLYLYAQRVGPTGRLFGLDLSEPMLAKARENLESLGVRNVEWLHAAADAIPLPDQSVDLVTANGIFNLSPDKDAVMREVARVLKPGGRMIFAEIVLKSELPREIRRALDDWFRCIGGALVQQDFLARLQNNGLSNPQVLSLGRNARTGHELALCAVIRAESPLPNANRSGERPVCVDANVRTQASADFKVGEQTVNDSIRATTTGECSRCATTFAWLAVTLALVGTLGSLLLSWGLGLKACPLCFYQRSFVMAAFAILGLGWFVERTRPGLICLLSVPLAWAGLGVAAFHEYLVLTNVLECPQALLGIGTAPAQSLAMFVVLAAVTTLGAWCGRTESPRQGTGTLIGAVILGAVMAAACVKSSPPLPPVPKQPYDPVKQPLDMCRPPFRGA